MDLIGHYDTLEHAVRVGDWEVGNYLRDLTEKEASLLDALGWSPDDPRIEYELPADSTLTDWLTRARENNEGGLEDSRHELARLQAGDKDFVNIGATMRESILTTTNQIGEWLTVLATIDRLLGQLDDLVGVVA
ncbi:MAG TPA: hypothetical protein VME22_06935 [Solirubrobacteraceae bacterium]|nr:hypothetical protein [Solirubrobacteraceae bacterium]